jgi:hypothetical protein
MVAGYLPKECLLGKRMLLFSKTRDQSQSFKVIGATSPQHHSSGQPEFIPMAVVTSFF